MGYVGAAVAPLFRSHQRRVIVSSFHSQRRHGPAEEDVALATQRWYSHTDRATVQPICETFRSYYEPSPFQRIDSTTGRKFSGS